MKALGSRFKISGIRKLVDISKQLNLLRRNIPVDNSFRFLVVSTTGIGDTLWGTPAIRALRETFAQSYIGVLTNPSGFEILKENPDIDDIFIFRREAKGYFLLPGLLKELKKKNIDTVFVFHASDRIIWPICFFTGATEIIGIDGQNKGLDFILSRALAPQDDIHGIEKRLEIVREVKAYARHLKISFYLTNKERTTAGSFLENNGINKDELLIGLHPGAQKPFKCWPSKKFIALGRILTEKLCCRIIVTGNAKERMLVDEVASGIRGAIHAAGKLSLRETAAVIEKMHVFITNDTGPMHIAFALGTPTIALFSPTDPRLCGPYNAESSAVIAKPTVCSPCIGKNCQKSFCMEQITVGEVLEKAESLLTINAGNYNKNTPIDH